MTTTIKEAGNNMFRFIGKQKVWKIQTYFRNKGSFRLVNANDNKDTCFIRNGDLTVEIYEATS